MTGRDDFALFVRSCRRAVRDVVRELGQVPPKVDMVSRGANPRRLEVRAVTLEEGHGAVAVRLAADVRAWRSAFVGLGRLFGPEVEVPGARPCPVCGEQFEPEPGCEACGGSGSLSRLVGLTALSVDRVETFAAVADPLSGVGGWEPAGFKAGDVEPLRAALFEVWSSRWRRCAVAELQTELLPPEPKRTIVGPGTFGWGVDPSTLRVSIAWAEATGTAAGEVVDRGVLTRSFPKEDNLGRRYALIYSETIAATKDAAGRCWPGLVWVEQPSGRNPNPRLSYAVGAIIAGLFAGLWSCAAGRALPEVETIESARWKKRAIGPGWANLKKDDGDLIAVARTLGYAGASFDEADAWLMVEALRRTVRLSA